ncbi:MAG: hypothetical protein P1U56_08115 [Saprospiraceae bacterium]|nr:hypothetical protein [Saprospiraceae bacterium]
MILERKLSKLCGKKAKTLAKNTNPFNVLTQYLLLPILIVLLWNRQWLGWIYIFPLVLIMYWLIFNPVFPKYSSKNRWASKAILGTDIYLNRDKIPIPTHHKIVILQFLQVIFFCGVVGSIGSAIYYSICGVTIGMTVAYLTRSWILDRMVWLYEDMKDTKEELEQWEF